MKFPIYLDYAATTPLHEDVKEEMMRYLTLDGCFANPASKNHIYGWQAEEAVEAARADVARLVGCDEREIVWTSGATEADNLAIKGVAMKALERGQGRHIITSQIEHKAVLDTCRFLQTHGFEVTYLPPDSQGIITPQQVLESLRPDTILVSLMQVNNELGTINDIAAISETLAGREVLFHVDAAQSLGKLPVRLDEMKVDLMSFSAHKCYGPKGVGALFVRREHFHALTPLLHGGGHERGLRSGTLATHQVVGMGKACSLLQQEFDQQLAHVESLQKLLWEGLREVPGVRLHAEKAPRVPHILNLGFNGCDGEALILTLKDIAISSGSACNSVTVEPSYVLRACGVVPDLAQSSIRFSLGRYLSEEEIEFTVAQVRDVVRRLINK